jgi:hypothetical protein
MTVLRCSVNSLPDRCFCISLGDEVEDLETGSQLSMDWPLIGERGLVLQ